MPACTPQRSSVPGTLVAAVASVFATPCLLALSLGAKAGTQRPDTGKRNGRRELQRDITARMGAWTLWPAAPRDEATRQRGNDTRTRPPQQAADARSQPEEKVMLHYAIVFFVIAIIAAVFGFTGIAAGAAEIAKILFYIFLVVFVVTLLLGVVRH